MCTVLRKYFSSLVHRNKDLRLLEVFKPLYYTLSIFGLFPHSIDFLYGNKYLRVAFKSATFALACNFVLPTVICVFFAFHTLKLDIASDDSAFDDELTKTNFIIEMVFQLLVCTTAHICAFKNRKLYIKVLNEMSCCWTKLPKNVERKILGQLQIKVYCIVFGSILLLPTLECFMILMYIGDLTAWKIILMLVTFALPELISFTFIAFYFVLIMMVVALLENIEEQVRILYQSITCWSSSNIGEEAKPLPASLRQLRGVYERVLAIKRQVNAAFQAPLLLVLAQSFHTLVSEAHAVIHGLTFQDFIALDVFDCCVWIVFNVIKIYILGLSGSILNQQAIKIGRTLHSTPADIDAADISLYLEIQHFTTLMTFQAAEITLYGYFSLESSLIFHVAASATTYLVILVQFDKGAD